jgi:hypothetical protein
MVCLCVTCAEPSRVLNAVETSHAQTVCQKISIEIKATGLILQVFHITFCLPSCLLHDPMPFRLLWSASDISLLSKSAAFSNNQSLFIKFRKMARIRVFPATWRHGYVLKFWRICTAEYYEFPVCSRARAWLYRNGNKQRTCSQWYAQQAMSKEPWDGSTNHAFCTCS